MGANVYISFSSSFVSRLKVKEFLVFCRFISCRTSVVFLLFEVLIPFQSSCKICAASSSWKTWSEQESCP